MAETQPRLHLWGVTTSRTLRAVWALHELSLDYVAHPILPRTGETKTAEFTRINPRQKIPVLQDGDFTIAESPAIIAYLMKLVFQASLLFSLLLMGICPLPHIGNMGMPIGPFGRSLSNSAAP